MFKTVFVFCCLLSSIVCFAEEGSDTLTFSLTAGVNAVIDNANGRCVSKPLSVPGPTGWGSHILGDDVSMKGRKIVESYYEQFREKCSKYGPLNEPPYGFGWNLGTDNVVEFYDSMRNAKSIPPFKGVREVELTPN